MSERQIKWDNLQRKLESKGRPVMNMEWLTDNDDGTVDYRVLWEDEGVTHIRVRWAGTQPREIKSYRPETEGGKR